tara:strand:+ start:96 stop:344 length:249 start_codon:yes stop_codon:yes gene_type:complete
MPRTVEITLKVKLRKLQGEEISDEGYEREDITYYDLDDVDVGELVDMAQEAVDSYFGFDCDEVYIMQSDPAVATKITAELKE